jgi:hypothetical protein
MDIIFDAQDSVKVSNITSKGCKGEVSEPRNNNAIEEVLKVGLKEIAEKLESELDPETRAYLRNKEELAAITKESDDYTWLMVGVSISEMLLLAILVGTGFAALSIPFKYGEYKLLEKAQELGQIKRVMSALIDEFTDEGIEIFPCLDIEGFSSVDIFIRFPTKKFFMVSLQDIGKNTLFHNSNKVDESPKELLYLKNANGRWKKFKSKKLDILPEQEKKLRKQHKTFLGGSSRDVKTGIIKILGICGKDAKITRNFPVTLSETTEGKRFYLAQKNPSIFVMREEEIIDFIKIKIQNKRF